MFFSCLLFDEVSKVFEFLEREFPFLDETRSLLNKKSERWVPFHAYLYFVYIFIFKIYTITCHIQKQKFLKKIIL